MPTYEYECLTNGHRFEVKQSFADASLTTCQVCGEPVRKIFSAAGIVFKGSGYYVTDSRAPEPSSSGSDGGAKGEGSKGEAGKGETAKGDGAKVGAAKGEGAKGEGSKRDSKSGGTGTSGAGSGSAKSPAPKSPSSRTSRE